MYSPCVSCCIIAIVKGNMSIQNVYRFGQHYFYLFLKQVFTSYLAQLHKTYHSLYEIKLNLTKSKLSHIEQ